MSNLDKVPTATSKQKQESNNNVHHQQQQDQQQQFSDHSGDGDGDILGGAIGSGNGAAGAGPFAKWNVIAYAGLNAGAFDSVDVIVHLDFDPCFGYLEEDLLAMAVEKS